MGIESRRARLHHRYDVARSHKFGPAAPSLFERQSGVEMTSRQFEMAEEFVAQPMRRSERAGKAGAVAKPLRDPNDRRTVGSLLPDSSFRRFAVSDDDVF